MFGNNILKTKGNGLVFRQQSLRGLTTAAASGVKTGAKSFVSLTRSRLWPRCSLTRGGDQDIEENAGGSGGDDSDRVGQ